MEKKLAKSYSGLLRPATPKGGSGATAVRISHPTIGTCVATRFYTTRKGIRVEAWNFHFPDCENGRETLLY